MQRGCAVDAERLICDCIARGRRDHKLQEEYRRGGFPSQPSSYVIFKEAASDGLFAVQERGTNIATAQTKLPTLRIKEHGLSTQQVKADHHVIRGSLALFAQSELQEDPPELTSHRRKRTMSTILQPKLNPFLCRARWLATIVLFLLIAQPAMATSDLSPRHANNGFLFCIEKGGKKSYLLGTIHGGLSDAQQLGDNIVSALQRSGRIFVEADTSDGNAITAALDNAGFSDAGPRLRSLIGDKYFQFFGHWLVDDLQLLTVEQYEHARPWFIAMLVPVANPKVEPAPALQYGSEEQIFTIARKKGVTIEELEGLESQYTLFNSMTPEQGSKYFLAFVERVQDRSLYHRQLAMIQAWTDSDFTSLEDVFRESEKLTDPYSRFWSEKAIHARNRSLSDKIARLAAASDAQLFAVGSLHLPGSDGIVAQLKRTGFTVTQLK